MKTTRRQCGGRPQKKRKTKGDDFVADDDEVPEKMEVRVRANTVPEKIAAIEREIPVVRDLLGYLTHQKVNDMFTGFERDPKSFLGDYGDYIEEAKQLQIDKVIHEGIAKANAGKTHFAGGIADGELVVFFNSVGSGDCIFIKTPLGEVIVVDCGSRARPENTPYQKRIQDYLKTHFLKPVTAGDELPGLLALILTHPDKDHCNEVVSILKPVIGNIRHLFYSGDLGKYKVRAAPLQGAAATVKVKKPDPVVEPNDDEIEGEDLVPDSPVYRYLLESSIRNKVTIDSVSKELLETEDKTTDQDSKHYTHFKDEKKVKIFDEADCKVYLLAGGVSGSNQKDRTVIAEETRPGQKFKVARDRYAKVIAGGFGTPANSGSIVTLIESYGKKILLCGDATYITEVFLLAKHKETIKKVDLAQMEHHGSGTEHAGGVYVETIDPRYAVASSGSHKGDKNPRWRAIEKYFGLKKKKPTDTVQHQRVVRLKQDVEAHFVLCYDEKKATKFDSTEWKPYENKAVYSTLSNDDVCFTLKRGGELELKAATKTTT